MNDTHHECYCGQPATNWLLTTLLDLTCAPLWLCEQHYAEERKAAAMVPPAEPCP